MTSFHGSSCVNNGKDALNTPETLPFRTSSGYAQVPSASSAVTIVTTHVDAKGDIVDVKGNYVDV
eukprot:1155885-Prorocentrum_minimum.AAC.3